MLASIRGLLRDGATHIGVATDHVIESFRIGLWPGYKTGAGIEPDLLAQFSLLEDAAVEEVSHAARHLLASLTTNAPPRDRDDVAAKARVKARARYGPPRSPIEA